MRILGATLTPGEDTFKGLPTADYFSAPKEQKRQAVNKWIRESGAFDGVIDFDAVVRDPQGDGGVDRPEAAGGSALISKPSPRSAQLGG